MVQATFARYCRGRGDRVTELVAIDGIEVPHHLVTQSDNATGQTNNSLVGQLLATLVVAGKFEECALMS